MLDITHNLLVCVNGKSCSLVTEIIFDPMKLYNGIVYGKVKCYMNTDTWDYVEGFITFGTDPNDICPPLNYDPDSHRTPNISN